MKYTVNLWNNFCRVFELPDKYIENYCFQGGHPTNFQMIDWFCPTDMGQPGVTKEVWKKEVGPIKTRELDLKTFSDDIVPFLKDKAYVKQGKKYLLLCDFGATLLFDKNGLCQ